MDHLSTLRVFCTVFESKSFTGAAQILGLSTPAVSRAITDLEERLGVRLFQRSTRHISLTEASENLYAGCTRVLGELDALEAQAALVSREPSGVLRLVAHTTVMSQNLTPLLATFRRRYPQVHLDLTLTERPVDLVDEGYDLGVVLPYMLTSEQVVTRLLMRMPLVVVVSPKYLETHAMPSDPSELAELDFLVISPSIRHPVLKLQRQDQQWSIDLKYDVCANNAVVLVNLALEGLGFATLPLNMIGAELAEGRLVRVFGDCEVLEAAVEVRLAYSDRRLMAAKVRAFVEHAVEFFEAMPPQAAPA
jgi:DNA-binding transcriptional LysR family regulator